MNPGLGFCCLLLFSVVCADADVQTSVTPLISSSLSPSPPSSQNSPSTSTTWTTATSPQLTSTPSSPPPPPPPPTTTDTPCIILGKSCQKPQSCCQAEHATCYSSICQCEENFFQDGTACSNVSRLKVTHITATSVGERYVTLGWTNPNDIKSNLTYTVNGHSWSSSMDKTITGLRPGHLYVIIITSSITQYNVTMQVNNTPVYIRTYPSQVTVLNNPARKVPATNFSLTFNISDGEASCYIITVRNQTMIVFNTTVHDNTTETIKTRIETLEPAKTYTISIITVSGDRHSKALTFPFTTKDEQSGVITRFNVTNVTNTSISVSWSPPRETRGSIIGYSLNASSGPIDQDFQLLLICSNCSYIQKTLKLQADVGMNISLNINKDVQYTIQNLLPFEEYTLTMNAYNEAGQGQTYLNRTRTSIGVPSPPKELDVFNISSSSVTLFWAHADHQDGPTTYYITVGEALYLTSDSFQQKTVVNVGGFCNTSVLVEGLRSYWRYTFNITAATPVGKSNVFSLNETVRTKESAPGKVENLHIEQIPGTFTIVGVFFSCPNETERHGDINYYTLSYEAQVENHNNVTENPIGLNISAEPESKCSYSQFVSVTPRTNYKFSVVAHDSFPGSETTEYHFANIGTPGKVSDFMRTSTTSTSISLSWEPPTHPNGYILGYILYVHTEDGECQQAVHIVCTDCQSHGTFRVEDDKCRLPPNVTVQKFETSPTNYDVTSLLSYTNYTFTVAAVNNFSMGNDTSLAVQTDIDVPSVPGNLSISVLNASAVEISWIPPTRKSGPTVYTIIPQEATGRLSSTYGNMENVTVNGYKSSKTTINGLLSSWRYTFSIVASTSKRGSLPVDLGSNIITQESQPCEVQNLKVSSIPGNFTAVNLTWDCPKERERNGFIRNYTIQYSDSGAVSMVYGHYKPEDPCDKTHTAILPVRPEHDYTFTVSANAMYRGKPKQSKEFHATAGKPLKKDSTDIFISTAAQGTDAATDSSFVISFDSKILLDGTNGKVVEAGILVMRKSETTPTDPENVTDWDTWKNWYKWKNSGYKASYRPTPQHYLLKARRRRSASPGESLTSYSVGVDENCDSEKDQFCNGPLEPETAYMVVAVSCTSAGCTSTEPFGNFKTKPLDDVSPLMIAFGVITALLLCVIIILVLYIKVVQPAKTQKSRGEGLALELSLRGTGQSEDIPYDEVACGSTSDYQNTHTNRNYENVDTRNQHTYESLASQVNDRDMHLYETVQVRL